MRQQNQPTLNLPIKCGEATVLSVEGFLVHPSVLNASIEVAGTLLPFEETEIHPEVAGKVIRLSIKRRSYRKKRNFTGAAF